MSVVRYSPIYRFSAFQTRFAVLMGNDAYKRVDVIGSQLDINVYMARFTTGLAL